MPDGICFSPFRAFVLWIIKIFLRNLRKGVDNIKSICYTIYRNSRKRGVIMAKYEDITGKRFGRLTVLGKAEKRTGQRGTFWNCICDCGRMTRVVTSDLKNGHSTSCGCKNRERMRKEGKKHAKNLKKHNEDKNFRENTNLSSLNMKISKANKSGRKGIFFDKARNKWRAEIMFKRKHIYIGRFDKLEDAIKARELAEEKYFEPVLNKYGRELKEIKND